MLPTALFQVPRGECVSLTVPTANPHLHIYFSFFSGTTIRFMFSGISYLRTYLVHLSFLLKQTQSITLIYKAFEEAENFSDDLNLLKKKKRKKKNPLCSITQMECFDP